MSLLSEGSLIYSMQRDPQFPLIVENSLNRKIKVSWLLPSGKTFKKRVEPGKKMEITTFDRVPSEAKVRFEVEGSLMRWTAAPVEIDKPELLKQAYALHLGEGESLCITVIQSAIYLKAAYSNQPMKKEKAELKSVLGLFKGFDAYPDLRNFPEEKILAFPSYKACIYSQDDGSIIATAEDIFRYVLSVDRDYDKSEINNAYLRIKLLWQDDDSSADPKRKQRAQRVLAIAQKAFKELDCALYARLIDEKRNKDIVSELVHLDTVDNKNFSTAFEL